MLDDPIELGPAEARHLRDLGGLWSDYGPALRTWSVLDGGMTWKSVAGGDYLCRYRQEGGRKRFTSLGRRSAETEKIYADFIGRRDGAKTTVISLRDAVAKGGRVAKAYGLARLPAKTAEIVRTLWTRKLTDEAVVFGGAALLAYELESGLMVPTELIRDEHLILVGRRSAFSEDELTKAYETAVGGQCRVLDRADRIRFARDGEVSLELWDPDALLSRAEPEEAHVLDEAIRLRRFTGLTVARDAQPVELSVFDPRAYAVAAAVIGHDERTWLDRAEFAVAVAGRLGLEFEADQAAILRGVVAGDSIDSPRI